MRGELQTLKIDGTFKELPSGEEQRNVAVSRKELESIPINLKLETASVGLVVCDTTKGECGRRCRICCLSLSWKECRSGCHHLIFSETAFLFIVTHGLG